MTTEVRDDRKTGGGRGLGGGRRKNSGWGISPDDLKAFCINADQWRTAAQGHEE